MLKLLQELIIKSKRTYMIIIRVTILLSLLFVPVRVWATTYVPEKTLIHNFTNSHNKAFYYSVEPYFRDSYNDFIKVLGKHKLPNINKYSFIIVRPDGIVNRIIDNLFKQLRNNDFEPMLLKEIRFNRFSLREMWRYNFNKSPIKRFALLDYFLPISDSMFVLVKDISTSNKESAASRLSKLKGSVNKSKRKDSDLRSLIHADSGLFSFIHTPDDTADFIREIGVLFTLQDRKEIAYIIKNKAKSNIDLNVIMKVYAKTPELKLEYNKAIIRITERLRLHISPQRIQGILREIQSKSFDIEQFFERYKNLDLDIWDIIIISSKHTPEDISNVISLLE